MKRLTFSLLIALLAVSYGFCQNGVKLEVGQKAPDWVFPDVDPDEQDLNEPFNEVVDKAVKVEKRIDSVYFKGIGIVDCKSTWKPNSLIRSIAGNKAKKFKTTILFDYDAKLQTLWGLPKDNYTIVIVDKNRICRALFKGKVPESEVEKTIQMIIKLTKE
jgi:predicted transcriptional regulator